MTKEELLAALHAVAKLEPESAHFEADELLLRYIADADIEAAYNAIHKWYT